MRNPRKLRWKRAIRYEEDTKFETPLSVNGFTFAPEKLGEYVLRYLLNDNGVESYLYHDMVIEDTTQPTFTLKLKESYAVGEQVKLTPKITDNSGKNCEVSYVMYIGQKNVTDQMENGVYIPREGGEHKVRVKVTDLAGNSTSEIFSFNVVGQTAEQEGTGGCSGTLGGVSGVVLSLGLALAIKRKKGGK